MSQTRRKSVGVAVVQAEEAYSYSAKDVRRLCAQVLFIREISTEHASHAAFGMADYTENVCEAVDLQRAYGQLREADQSIIYRRYAIGESLSSAETKRLQRAIDRLAEITNNHNSPDAEPPDHIGLPAGERYSGTPKQVGARRPPAKPEPIKYQPRNDGLDWEQAESALVLQGMAQGFLNRYPSSPCEGDDLVSEATLALLESEKACAELRLEIQRAERRAQEHGGGVKYSRKNLRYAYTVARSAMQKYVNRQYTNSGNWGNPYAPSGKTMRAYLRLCTFDPDAFEAARRSGFWGWDRRGIALGRQVDSTFCTVFGEVQLAYKALHERDRDLIFRKYALGEALSSSEETQVSRAIGSMIQKIAGRMGHETVAQQFRKRDRQIEGSHSDWKIDPENIPAVNARGFTEPWESLTPEAVLAFKPERVQWIIDARRTDEGLRDAG